MVRNRNYVLGIYQKWNPILHGYSTTQELNLLDDKFILLFELCETTYRRVENIFRLVNLQEINDEYLDSLEESDNNFESGVLVEEAEKCPLKFGLGEIIICNVTHTFIPKNYYMRLFFRTWYNRYKRRMKYYKSIKYHFNRQIGLKTIKYLK